MSYIPSNMNRSRPKIEKENENKDIKKKLKSVQPRVQTCLTYQYTEKPVPMASKHTSKHAVTSKTNNLNTTERHATPSTPKSRIPINSITHNSSLDEADSYLKTLGIFPNHKPLSPYMNSAASSKHRSVKLSKVSARTNILPSIDTNELEHEREREQENITVFKEGSVYKLFTPRNDLNDISLSDSGESRSQLNSSRIPVLNSISNDTRRSPRCHMDSPGRQTLLSTGRLDLASISSGSSTYLNLDLDLCSLPSPESMSEYYMAPLISAPSATKSLDTSAVIVQNFRHVLEHEHRSMTENDIKVVKDVLKTDERHNLLNEPDPKLFKDILKTQLVEIVKSEKVVKNALHILGGNPKEIENRHVEGHNTSRGYRHMSHEREKSRRKVSYRFGHHSTDSSPRSISNYANNDYNLVRSKHDVAKDTFAMQTPRHVMEKKPEKSRRHQTEAQEEFEDFVKNTLPLKRKTWSSNRQTSNVSIIRNAMEEHTEYAGSKSAKKPQVNVTFKNVSSLEKEIIILKALGERLEATLRRSVSEPSMSDIGYKDDLIACSSSSSLTREIQKIDPSISVFPGRRVSGKFRAKPLLRIMDILTCCEYCIGKIVFSKGIRHEIGIVKEFVIVSKTIDELLSDSNSKFYIPNGNEPGALEPTSFRKLAEHPQILMRYLKPKNSATPFNLLDQDPVFFNSFLLPNLQNKISERYVMSESASVTASASATASATASETSSKEKITICEGGDSMITAAHGIRSISIEPSCSKFSTRRPTTIAQHKIIKARDKTVAPLTPITPITHVAPSTSSVSTGATVKRARMRRSVTPMPLDAYDEPKNSLLKTILVGTVQISIFLVMIMAITYPDIKC